MCPGGSETQGRAVTMANSDTPTDDGGKELVSALRARRMRIDWFLEGLVQQTNEHSGATLPVTLNVGGTLISGYLVSGADYFDGLGKELAEAIKEPDAR